METDILKNIVEVYSRLWSFRERGDTVEIITPCSTTNDSFVSVFLTQRENEFIITDGGWISEKYYNDLIDLEDDHLIDCMNTILRSTAYLHLKQKREYFIIKKQTTNY